MKKISFLVFVMVLVLGACAPAATAGELERSRAKWQAAGIDHYRFRLGVGCFCPVGDLMPLTVEVQDGEVIRMTDVNGNPIQADDPMVDFILRYATIERIFSELASDEVQEADELRVQYDPEYGYPVEVTIDYLSQAVDEELYLSVSDVEPLS